MTKCQRNYRPSGYVTIDETILSFRGRCGFRVYTPNKPDRYGLKLFSLCDSRSAYLFSSLPYIGRGTLVGESTLRIPTRQVLQLVEPIVGSNRTITVDNYFTSIELANELLAKNLTMVGTMRKNRPEIPTRMLRARRQDVQQSQFIYQRDRVMASYVPKFRKAVVLLSTAHTDEGRVDSNNGKPVIINFYNSTKAGVDTMNQMMHSRTTTRKTRRWPMRYFFAMLDAAGINAHVIHKLNGGRLSRFEFLEAVATGLVIPHVQERLSNQRIQRSLKVKIGQFLDLPPPDPILRQERTGRPPGRCVHCPRARDRRAAVYCYQCERGVCGEHRRYVCISCIVQHYAP